MAWVSKSDGTRVEVPDVEIWGKPPTAAEQVIIDRNALVPVTRMQFAIAIAANGIITAQEAKDFAGGNSLPAFAIIAIQNSGLSQTEQMAAEIKALAAITIQRMNPVVLIMQRAKSLTDAQVDGLFKTAAEIE